MELIMDPFVGGIITGAIKFILVVGITIGVIIAVLVTMLFRR